MPELPDERKRFEADLRQRLRGVIDTHSPAIVDALGQDARGTLASTASGVWGPFERALGDESYWPLLLAYLISFDNLDDEFGRPLQKKPEPEQPGLGLGDGFGLPSYITKRPGFVDQELPAVDERAYRNANGFADEMSKQLARGVIINTADRLDKVRRRQVELPLLDLPAGGDGTKAKPPDLDWEREFSKTLGDDRIERIGATEITRSISAGEGGLVASVRLQLGWGVVAIWNTERDGKVCPICRPMDGTDEDFFGPRVGFPPAHVNCRCFATWKIVEKPEPAAV